VVKPVLERVPGIRSIFCDSIEVEGHNWSGVLLDEFRRRRGYDLTPYIYALWGDMGEMTPHVRYDYFKTMSELTIENFFDPLTAFAHEHGCTSRIQAHGTWGDILRVYAAADIPEGETFGDHRTLEVNTIHRRLAASAAHIYGRPVVSNETFTWLKRPRFTETLEEMKAAVDATTSATGSQNTDSVDTQAGAVSTEPEGMCKVCGLDLGTYDGYCYYCHPDFLFACLSCGYEQPYHRPENGLCEECAAALGSVDGVTGATG